MFYPNCYFFLTQSKRELHVLLIVGRSITNQINRYSFLNTHTVDSVELTLDYQNIYKEFNIDISLFVLK